LSEEERNALLEQMKRDAEAHIEQRIQQLRKRHEEDKKEEEEYKNRTNVKDQLAPQFIRSVPSQTDFESLEPFKYSL
jgi:hypothetical protein